MIAGRMKHWLLVLHPVIVQNEVGEEETTWKECCRIHAERVKQTGHRSEEVAEHFPDIRTEFNIRDVHTVEANWRVKQLGGELFNVVAVLPNLDKGYKTLVCERVNE